MKSLTSIIVILFALLAMGCENDPVQECNDRQDITLSRGGAEVVNANNEFAVKLLDAMKEDKENMVVSPLSLYQYLSMVANGAEGDTKNEIVSVLGCEQLSLDDINHINSELVSRLRMADKKTVFTLSNSLWHVKDVDMLPNYIAKLNEYYGSEIHIVDSLNSESVLKDINKWCEKNTSGMVKNFLKNRLPADLKYVSYNATYFKSKWEKPFEFHCDSEFHNADGSATTTTYISAEVLTQFFENDDFQYVEIPYGNGAFAFTVILPKENTALSVGDIIAQSTNSKSYTLRVIMPKFNINYNRDMSQVLKTIGICMAYLPESDFTNASEYNQPLPSVMHATSIVVDEKGSEVASVSGSGELWATLPKSIKIDRPFIFLIKETSTAAILYIGKVNKL